MEAQRPAAPSSADSFERAERLRKELETRPEQQRTRPAYSRVLDAYRDVYHNDPASPRADASISAVAALLAEEGRVFRESKPLNDAVAQYEFLRREYPGSRYRFSAMIAEGEIYFHDLADPAAAEAVFQTFLKLYPGNALAKQARLELAEIHAEEPAEKAASRTSSQRPKNGVAHPPAGASSGDLSAAPSSSAPPSVLGSSYTRTSSRSAKLQGSPFRVADGTVPPSNRQLTEAEQTSAQSSALPNAQAPRRGRLPLVTGVRHWSTPVYTRVAIDLEDEVQYEAARVPDPDRIFFDLHGARLSPELIGKSVQVTDDGFLKRIRVAQYSDNVARVVLDVSDVSDYSAFLLPNPYRLIIDIHGRKASGGALAAQNGSSTRSAQQSSTTSPHAVAPPVGGPAPKNAMQTNQDDNSGLSSAEPPASSATARSTPRISRGATMPVQEAATLGDVASLDRQPNRIRATRRPTTAPISASVAGTTAAPQPGTAAAAVGSRPPHIAAAPGKGATRDSSADVHEAEPTADGGRSLSRALGLKIGRIVVDAGHGGHDSGTLGPDGIMEKDVVLDVALRLGKLLKRRLGADVIFTRDDDTFIPLETRTAIANKAQADLFISVHANSSPDPDARGVETYYLSFTSSADALEVAARENAVSQQSIHQLADLVKKIAMQDKIDESREFATDVERSLYTGLTTGQSQNSGLRDRGVKKAPFVVLIGANMPSILAEISFLTNPEDARQLRDPAYRERIAESLYLGVARYVGGLNGVRLANNPTAH